MQKYDEHICDHKNKIPIWKLDCITLKYLFYLVRLSICSSSHRLVITGRNEVVAKVIFLHLSVIHSVHRGRSASVHAGIPPGPGRPPRSRHPPPQEQTPPGSRHPPWEQTPPGPGRPPPRKQTPAYGLRAAGTHPTGMHSCF